MAMGIAMSSDTRHVVIVGGGRGLSRREAALDPHAADSSKSSS
jgi:hypothetical protein